MSTDIKIGQVWKDRVGPARAHVGITDVGPTRVQYRWLDDSVASGTPGTRYVDEFLRDFEPADPTPAPLDPSKVKAGDTVTLERGEPSPAKIEGVVKDVKEYPHHEPKPLRFFIGGYLVSPYDYTLTAHQRAPEPEPEWKPGTFVSGEFEGRRDQGVVTDQGDFLFWNHTGSHMQEEPLATVRDLRPLVVIDPAAARKALEDNGWGEHETNEILHELGIEVAR